MTTTTSTPIMCSREALESRHRENVGFLHPEKTDRSSAQLQADEFTTFGLIELLLKDQQRLNTLSKDAASQRMLIPGLLIIGVGGYTIFAVVLSIIFCFAGVWPQLTPIATWLRGSGGPLLEFMPLGAGGIWHCIWNGSPLHLIFAYVCGLIGAIGVCLPSFYFYSLLAGIRASLLQVTTSALNGLASGALAALGALPIYLAGMLGLVIFQASSPWLSEACFLGLALPFLTGLYGTRALYTGFVTMATELPIGSRGGRVCFLRRLLLAWSGCYTAVTPVMIFALWEYMGR